MYDSDFNTNKENGGKDFRILIAIDKFKGSLTSAEAADAVERGLRQASSVPLQIEKIPIADGGDGSTEVIKRFRSCEEIFCRAAGPLGEPVDTGFLLYDLSGAAAGTGRSGKGAFIEMARVCGLAMVPAERRNPLLATTYGAGELIRKALDRGADEIVLSIGGSATNDGGTGLLQALGIRFLDEKRVPVVSDSRPFLCGALLEKIRYADVSGLDPRLKTAAMRVVCDVTNPLWGPLGATRVYGPQKGAGIRDIERLEAGMKVYAKTLLLPGGAFGKTSGGSGACCSAAVREERSGFVAGDECLFAADPGGMLASLPGAGAAGGTGYALRTYLGAEMIGGKAFFLALTDMERRVERSGLVITGEGALDLQSFQGKVVDWMMESAVRCGKPCWILCGRNRLKKELGEQGKSGFSGTGLSGKAVGAVSERLSGILVKSLAEIEPDPSRSIRNAAELLERQSGAAWRESFGRSGYCWNPAAGEQCGTEGEMCRQKSSGSSNNL